MSMRSNDAAEQDRAGSRGGGSEDIALGVGGSAAFLAATKYRKQTKKAYGAARKVMSGAGTVGKGIHKGYNWFRSNKMFEKGLGDPDKKMAADHAKKMAKNEFAFKGGIGNPLNKIENLFEDPSKLGAKAHWWNMTGGQNVMQSWKTSLKWGTQSLPIIGGIAGTMNMTMAATMPGNPFKNYAASTIDAFVSPGMMRVGAGIGMGLGRMIGGGLGRVIGGFIGGGTAMVVGSLASYAAVEVPGMIQSFVKENIRYSTFNKKFIDSEGAQTMRQASLQAIRNTELNNRSFVLGNEANYFSGGY